MDLLNAVNKLTGQPEQKGVIRKQLDSFEETLGLDQKKESTIEKKVDETVEVSDQSKNIHFRSIYYSRY